MNINENLIVKKDIKNNNNNSRFVNEKDSSLMGGDSRLQSDIDER
jgi:hypothetical protein